MLVSLKADTSAHGRSGRPADRVPATRLPGVQHRTYEPPLPPSFTHRDGVCRGASARSDWSAHDGTTPAHVKADRRKRKTRPARPDGADAARIAGGLDECPLPVLMPKCSRPRCFDLPTASSIGPTGARSATTSTMR